MRITSLDFGSLLCYTPRGSSPEIDRAREVMKIIKADDFVNTPPILMSEWLARTVHQHIGSLRFASFFQKDTVLVPVPSSSLMQPNSLWVPNRIANALVKEGIGKEVAAWLVRKTPVRKAAWSKPADRPKPKEHIATISVQGRISEPLPDQIVLVDDIITRGSTLLGAANSLAEALPKAQIRAFVAMMTISDPSHFVTLYKPSLGSVQYRPLTEDTIRRP
ncbi:MAG: hypothetical protein AUF79_12630 [Crenarchaeota archaeon 13_1_20CM_2_51_8]|nr:MAG: hypothetical protein AUF79_12630 [Crenarchaeota archaeon 13_1_20CM_2_51_8]